MTCRVNKSAMLIAFLLMGLFPNVVTYLLAAVLAGFGFGGLEPALQSMAVAIAPPERRRCGRRNRGRADLILRLQPDVCDHDRVQYFIRCDLCAVGTEPSVILYLPQETSSELMQTFACSGFSESILIIIS